MLYNLRALLDKQPVTISAAIFAVLNVLVVAGIVDVSAEVVSAGNTALVMMLGLFVNSKTVNTARLTEFGDHSAELAFSTARETVKALSPAPKTRARKTVKSVT